MINGNRHIVVCKNKKQAKDLYNRLIELYRVKKLKIRLTKDVLHDVLQIDTPFETFRFVPERSLHDMVGKRKSVECRLVSAKVFDEWLDNPDLKEEIKNAD